jgi:tetratricopeptide (TPR) repeat protein
MKSAPRPLIPMDHAEAGLPEGQARQALTLALRTLDMAQLHQRPADMSTALALVARSLKALGAYPAAAGYLLQARRWATLLPGRDALIDLECELAEVACARAEAALAAGDERSILRQARGCTRAHALEAAKLAAQASDGQWEVKVLLRVSEVLDRCGDHDDAATLQNRAISLMGLNAELAEVPALQDPAVETLLMAPGSNLLM